MPRCNPLAMTPAGAAGTNPLTRCNPLHGPQRVGAQPAARWPPMRGQRVRRVTASGQPHLSTKEKD